MPFVRRLLPSAAIIVAGLPTIAMADEKPTIQDRVDQIVATFMGDPAANVDIDMKHVLDAWRAMKPKPLEELTPEDARRQPSPIDAAASLLSKQGRTLDPYKVEIKDVTFAGPAGDLKARIYTPGGPIRGGRCRSSSSITAVASSSKTRPAPRPRPAPSPRGPMRSSWRRIIGWRPRTSFPRGPTTPSPPING